MRPIQILDAGVIDVRLPAPLQKYYEAGHEQQQADRGANPGLYRGAYERRATGPRLRAHSRRKTFADQPSDDQHDALDAERHHAGEQRLAGEIVHAFPGSPTCRQRQYDAGRAEQRQTPVRKYRIFNGCGQAPGNTSPEQQYEDAGEKNSDANRLGVLGQLVDQELDVHPDFIPG